MIPTSLVAAVTPRKGKWPQCFWKRRKIATKWYITPCV